MDNTTLAEVTWPTLTSVDLGSAERARIAAELLLERIEEPGARAAGRRRRAAPRRPRLVGGAGVSAVPEVGRRSARPQPGRVGLSGRETMLLLIPALLPIVILSVLPLVRGIYLGFTDSQAGFELTTNFIGLDNFRALLDDELFVNSFKIGLIWSVAVTAIGFCFALGLALLLSQDLKRPLARPLARARPLGDAGGGRRDHVEALLPAAGGDPERDPPPHPHPGRDDRLALELHAGRCRR